MVPSLGGGRTSQTVARVGGVSVHVVPALSADRATVTELAVLLTFPEVTAVDEALRAFLQRRDLSAALGVADAFATGVAVTR